MFVINVPYLNLSKLYESGQCLRWIRLNDSTFVVLHKDMSVKVQQSKDRLIMSCTDQQFFDVWFNYFDMANDYSVINAKAARSGEFMKICSVRGSGLRTLRPDIFECMLSSILISSFGKDEARKYMNDLCSICGTKHVQSMRESGRVTWYELPTALDVLIHEDELDKDIYGNIIRLCHDIDNEFCLEDLSTLNYYEIYDVLKKFDYISKLAIDYICLYGLHMNVIPNDNVLIDAMLREFEFDDVDIIIEWHMESMMNFKGMTHQYIMWNELNKPK